MYHFKTDHLPTDPRYAVTAILPEMAQAFIERHEKVARPSRKSRDESVVRTYAGMMERGEWRLNGDTIIVASNGEILDGLARLRAVVRAGVDILGIMVTGVDPAARSTINTHIRRSATDVLTINGEEFPSTIANAWSVIVGYVSTEDKTLYAARGHKVGLLQAEALTDRYPEIRDSVKAARPLAGIASGGTLAAFHFLFAKVDGAKADAFFADLAKEEPTGAVAAQLRRRLVALRKGMKTPRTYLAAIVVKAWERYRKGRTISLAGLDYAGNTESQKGMEAFPAISSLPEIDLAHDERAVDGPVGESGEGVRIFPVVLDEDAARHLLEHNGPVGTERNRSLRRKQVQRLARDITGERWGFNGQTIKIAKSGRMIDGQHRCHAVLLAGKAIRTYVVTGIEDDVFSTFDAGKRRSMASILRAEGETYEFLYAGALSALFAIKEPRAAASHGELLEIYESEPGLADSVTHVGKWRHQCTMLKVESSSCAALHYLFSKKDPEKAEQFMTAVMEGEGLTKSMPAYGLRERLLRHARARTGEPDRIHKMRMIVAAWNLFRQGRSMPRNGFSISSGPLPAIQ